MSDTGTSPEREGFSGRRRRGGRTKGRATAAPAAVDSDAVGAGGALPRDASPRTDRARRWRTAAAAASDAASMGAESLEEYDYYYSANPRSFPYHVKQQCWEKSDKVKGRDPARWRRDALGNLIFRKLVGCPGCLCHDYDHIVPYSKGGKSTLENCQVLQATVNRAKGNKTEISKAELIQKSAYCRVSGRDMDLLELSAYGNVHRGQDSGGCNIQ